MKTFLILFSIFTALVSTAVAQQSSDSVPIESQDRNLKILYKPRPAWPNRAACLQGIVILRIQFLDSGKLGNIRVIKGLTVEASKKAIEAAERIRFLPAIKDGNAITVYKQVEFSFSIY